MSGVRILAPVLPAALTDAAAWPGGAGVKEGGRNKK